MRRLGGGAAAALLLVLTLSCDRESPVELHEASAAGKTSTADPTVSSTSPAESPRDTTLDIRILGTGYDRSAQASFLLAGQPDARVRTNSTTYVSATEVVANVTISADAVPNRYDVRVTLSSGKKGIGTELFAVLPILALNTGSSGIAYGANTSGTVVGRYDAVGPCGTLVNQPFAWTAVSGLQMLPLPAGSCGGAAIAVDDAGMVVGWASGGIGVRWTLGADQAWTVERLGYQTNGDPVPEAVDIDGQGRILVAYGVWSSAGGFTGLLMGPGLTGCIANGMSRSGQVAGACQGSTGGNQAVVWPTLDSGPIALPGLSGAVGTVAQDVNSTGVVTGYVTVRNKLHVNEYHAVRWLPGQPYTIQDLGSLGGGSADARAINDAGQIVGRSAVSGGNMNAFVWEPGAGMINLGSFRSYGSSALGISQADGSGRVVIVGSSTAGATRWIH